jgi:hypothetical protein
MAGEGRGVIRLAKTVRNRRGDLARGLLESPLVSHLAIRFSIGGLYPASVLLLPLRKGFEGFGGGRGTRNRKARPVTLAGYTGRTM